MRLTATDIHEYYRPSICPARIFFKQHGVKETPPGPYDKVLARLGQEHEKRHLATFPGVVSLAGGVLEERISRTRTEVTQQSPIVYQAALQASIVLSGLKCDVVGRPDFLIHDRNGDYIIRDSKMSRRITGKDHPEIMRELDLYGWLYEQSFGKAPARLQVHCGTGEIVDVSYHGGTDALATLEHVCSQKQAAVEPYSPVGWSKCGGCGFHVHCWPAAEQRHDVALVQGVDQGLATAFREKEITTYDQLLTAFDEESLTEFKRPFGNTMRKVGTAAKSILLNAQAMASGKEILIQPPAMPCAANYVMFDLEGLPPQMDEVEKIYLWGIQVFGEKPSKYLAGVAGFGTDGDREGWEDFLRKAGRLLEDYGDLPFIHWHHYEKTHIDMYVKRFGDPHGIAARVRENLCDLLPIAKASVALPLPSNSLKVVEKYVGFTRKLADYRGDTAIARFIEATEMEDEAQRQQVMNEILLYNKEDLEAMWAVLQWLWAKSGNN